MRFLPATTYLLRSLSYIDVAKPKGWGESEFLACFNISWIEGFF